MACALGYLPTCTSALSTRSGQFTWYTVYKVRVFLGKSVNGLIKQSRGIRGKSEGRGGRERKRKREGGIERGFP